MGRAVCNNCWTWYDGGESVCRTCKLPLTMADSGAPAFVAGGQQAPSSTPRAGVPGTPPGAAPASSGFNWMRLAPVGVIVAVAVIAFAVVGSLHLGGPIQASDGSFSVKNPGSWYPTTWSLFRSYHVVLSIESIKGGAKSDFAVVDPQQQVPLGQIASGWEQLPSSGQLPASTHLGSISSLTVGGAPALAGAIDGDQDGVSFQGQVIFINYNGRTYIVALVSNARTYGSMRSDFDTLLSSWTWLR